MDASVSPMNVKEATRAVLARIASSSDRTAKFVEEAKQIIADVSTTLDESTGKCAVLELTRCDNTQIKLELYIRPPAEKKRRFIGSVTVSPPVGPLHGSGYLQHSIPMFAPRHRVDTPQDVMHLLHEFFDLIGAELTPYIKLREQP